MFIVKLKEFSMKTIKDTFFFKENIFSLTVPYLEKYSSTVQQLAYRGWHQVKRQEELPTAWGGEVGDGGAEVSSAIGARHNFIHAWGPHLWKFERVGDLLYRLTGIWKDSAEKSCILFNQFLPIVTFYAIAVLIQYKNQERTLVQCVCVCVCSCVCVCVCVCV